MTKIVAYTALHYGKSYLDAAIRSVIDAVDEYFVIYTPEGSHGHKSALACPDTREDLLEIAASAAGDKLRWFEGTFSHEGQHRDTIMQIASDADLVIVLDSDEIWRPDQLDTLLATASNGQAREYLAYEMPFWRSFRRAIPDKLCQPTRAINTRKTEGTQSTDTYFAHFGYCQPTEYITYKMSLHGHKADWRADWFETKWLPNAQLDLHPTNVNFWNAKDVDPNAYLPEWMKSHPYAKMEVIE